MWREDKFRKNDLVSWTELGTPGRREKYGEGPFFIVTVEDIPYYPPHAEYQSNWDSMGHTQFVTVETAVGPHQFSGAYFVRGGE